MAVRSGAPQWCTLALVALLCTLAEAARLGIQGSNINAAVEQHARVYLRETGLIVELVDLQKASSARADDDAVAWAEYSPQAQTKSNFGRLRIESSGQYPDDVQMRAIGYLEGFLTAEPIWQHWLNMQWYLSENTNKTEKLNRWLSKQRDYIAAQVAANKGDQFWDMQGFISTQLEGMVDGYNARIASDNSLPLDSATMSKAHKSKSKGGAAQDPIQALSFADFHLINSFGDMDDLLIMMEQDWLPEDQDGDLVAATQLLKQKRSQGPLLHPRWQTMTPGETRAHIATSGHCSALIKVTSDLSDILMGHTTWWSYSSLMRLYKHIITHLAHPAVAAQKLSFSSYPGLVHSMDDFMITDSGLVMMETSNDVYDLSLYALSTNQGALSWQRARAAIMLATDGPTFAQYIQMHNSGTYNNQYMVVDLERFIPGQQLQAGLLTVVETVPGGGYVADTTQELERGYWPSYNIPYFMEVYNKTGYPNVMESLRRRGQPFHSVATGLSYQVAPRAKIFRRDSGNVNSLSDLKKVLRSNGWSTGKQSDPFSPSPYDAICSRGDLDPDHPTASGCYDAKVTSYKLASLMQAEVVNGPAWDGDGSNNGHPAFDWRDWKDTAHYGMITQYRTVFELQKP